jgi:hypothetical protein
LEEVLWFYGNEYNYQGCVDPDYQWTGQVKEYPSDVVEDEGAKAREVLQKESNQ